MYGRQVGISGLQFKPHCFLSSFEICGPFTISLLVDPASTCRNCLLQHCLSFDLLKLVFKKNKLWFEVIGLHETCEQRGHTLNLHLAAFIMIQTICEKTCIHISYDSYEMIKKPWSLNPNNCVTWNEFLQKKRFLC